MPVSLPVVVSLAGLGLVYGAWSRRIVWPRTASITGWLLIALSFALWVDYAGAEFGSVYAILALAPAAWLYVVLNPKRGKASRSTVETRRPLRLPARARLLRNVALFVVVMPLAAVSSILVALVASMWLPWSEIDRLVAALLAMPVIWGLMAYWACADEKLLRPAATVIVAGLLSGVVLYT